MHYTANSAVELQRARPHVKASDILAAVYGELAGSAIEFGPVSPDDSFGQLIVAAFDRGMEPSDWRGLLRNRTSDEVHQMLLRIWRDEVWPAFLNAYRLQDATGTIPN